MKLLVPSRQVQVIRLAGADVLHRPSLGFEVIHGEQDAALLDCTTFGGGQKEPLTAFAGGPAVRGGRRALGCFADFHGQIAGYMRGVVRGLVEKAQEPRHEEQISAQCIRVGDRVPPVLDGHDVARLVAPAELRAGVETDLRQQVGSLRGSLLDERVCPFDALLQGGRLSGLELTGDPLGCALVKRQVDALTVAAEQVDDIPAVGSARCPALRVDAGPRDFRSLASSVLTLDPHVVNGYAHGLRESADVLAQPRADLRAHDDAAPLHRLAVLGFPDLLKVKYLAQEFIHAPNRSLGY